MGQHDRRAGDRALLLSSNADDDGGVGLLRRSRWRLHGEQEKQEDGKAGYVERSRRPMCSMHSYFSAR